MTATRFYLPSTGAAAVSPAFTLSGFSWTHTASADRIAAVTTKINSAVTDKVVAGTGGIGIDQLFRQYVSAPIPAQTIGGTVKGQIRALEELTSADARAQIVIYVVSNDGSTLRGVLYAGDTGALASEFTNAGRVNRKFPRSSPVSVSSVSAATNDRIVMEIGARRSGAGAVDVYLVFGDTTTGSDLPEDETTTTSTMLPWIEFSDDLFNPSTPASATVSAGTLTLTGQALIGASANVLGTASQGTLTLTGQALTAARLEYAPTAAQGTLTLTGKALTLAAADGYAAVFDPAILTLSGQDVQASWEAPDTAILSRATLTLTGKALTGASAEVLAALDTGTLTFAGQDMVGRADVKGVADQGVLTLTGKALAGANATIIATSLPGTLTLTGQSLAVSAAASAVLTRGTLTLTGVLVVGRQGFSFYQVHII